MSTYSFTDSLQELSRLADLVSTELREPVQRASMLLAESLRAGGKVLACGNGGSAADAQHFVAELVVRLGKERPSLPAISLSSDPSVMTALGNDYGYEEVFSRQVEGFGNPGDVLIGLSTSGKSKNVLRAIKVAQARGLKVIVLTGERGDPLLNTCDVRLAVPSTSTQFIQEIHMPLLHGMCALAEELLFPTPAKAGSDTAQ